MELHRPSTALFVFAFVLLSFAALRTWKLPEPVHAQSVQNALYIEPGVYMLRAPDGSKQVLGKVVIDLTNGKVWGFPTTVQQPYPVNTMSTDPPTSKPFLLGKFDLSAISKH
ncbi:MAG: hypothetical protein JOY54_08405 [Acidobacteriaceae bacterium]|nr:hypothetical protein [Acidobacteriaceae bacterium]